ncbi:MAG: hypothetical protein M3Z06_14755 [Actinomycetota bacterium]|nr:hypothetical protein [Actinomycetota bacterium]
MQSVEARGGRRFVPGLRRDYLAPAAAVLVVLVIGAAFLGLRGHESSGSSAASGAGARLVLTASGPDGRAPTTASLDRSIEILRRRLAAEVPGARVSHAGDEVLVLLPHSAGAARARVLALSAPGQLALYDWEADALTPNGRTVARQLGTQNAAALRVSQGNGGAAPGSPGAGSLPPIPARSLAAKARSRYRIGTVVLRAQTVSRSPRAPAQFYVLLNHVALSERDLAAPRQSTDPAGSPTVTFGFTSRGRRAFQHVTSSLARRGASVSGLGQTLNQHFAIALDGQLISVPSVDSRVYPDGIIGGGAGIDGGFTLQSARDLATLLRFGPLGVRLTAR